jgi:hypothetical protein
MTFEPWLEKWILMGKSNGYHEYDEKTFVVKLGRRYGHGHLMSLGFGEPPDQGTHGSGRS